MPTINAGIMLNVFPMLWIVEDTSVAVQMQPIMVLFVNTVCTFGSYTVNLCSQGSRLVFQSVVFQLIFATLNMYFREYSNSRQKFMDNPS